MPREAPLIGRESAPERSAKTRARASSVVAIARICIGLSFFFAAGNAFARRGGIGSPGCAGCHRGGAAPRVTLVTSPAVFNPGDTVQVSVSIQAVNGNFGGLYLVSSVGRFVAGAGMTRISDTELTHSQPKAASGGSVNFESTWTAPPTPGGTSFQVFALSANGDGTPNGDGEGDAELNSVFGCAGTTYYSDLDNDGWAPADAVTIRDCQKPPGYAAQLGDCSDSDPNIHPGAPERCNQRDDNCDGQIDEGLTGVFMAFPDKDGDGFGAINAVSMLVDRCTPPPGYALRSGDCDDRDPAINPGATEICNLRDDNCDGRSDESVRPICGLGACRRYSVTCDPASCMPGEPSTELCNLIDDDCDGIVDNGAQVCPPGQVCNAGACTPNGTSPAAGGSSSTAAAGSGGSSSTGAASDSGGADGNAAAGHSNPTGGPQHGSAGSCALAFAGDAQGFAAFAESFAVCLVIALRRLRRFRPRRACHVVLLASGTSLACGSPERSNLGGADASADSHVPLPLGMASLSAGAGHTCALSRTHDVACWGSNPDGQLGDGTLEDRARPGNVSDLADVTQISSGSYHSCGLLSTGNVSCWGWNVAGQIGDGTSENRAIALTVAGLDTVVGVAAGSYHSCALLASGSARCWGQNDSGQLGDGSVQDRARPVEVFSLPQTRALAAAGRHSCALLEDTSVQCWGSNDFGELGDGTQAAHPLPAPVTGISGARAISAGFNHSCALLDGGAVRCWGANAHGQLGNGSFDDSSLPVSVSGLGPASSIATGYNHSCAVLENGSAACWGWNAAGQLGDGSTEDRPLPVTVSDLAEVITLAGGGFHTCARSADGSVSCWGSNDSGQLGNGTTAEFHTPTRVVFGPED